jgi:hypothetical protein
LLTWAAPYNGGSTITGYKVYRKTAGTAYALLASVGGGSDRAGRKGSVVD